MLLFHSPWIFGLIVMVFCSVCPATGAHELDRDFLGLLQGTVWIYEAKHSFIFPDVVFIDIGWYTHSVVDVQKEEDRTLFFMDKVWKDGQEEVKLRSDVKVKDSGGYYIWGYWIWDNDEKLLHPDWDRELIVAPDMVIGDRGLWDLELVDKEETVTVQAGTFVTWLLFYREEIPEERRETARIWFAPYIGFVKEEYLVEGWEDGGWVKAEHLEKELVECRP